MEERISRRAALRAGPTTAGMLAVGGLAACGGDSKTAGTTAAGGTQAVTVRFWTHDKLLVKPLMEHWAKVLSAEPNPPYRYTVDTTITPEVPTKARAAFLAHSNAPAPLNLRVTAFSQMTQVRGA